MKQFYKIQWNIKCSTNVEERKMMEIKDSSQIAVWELDKMLLVYTKTVGNYSIPHCFLYYSIIFFNSSVVYLGTSYNLP